MKLDLYYDSFKTYFRYIIVGIITYENNYRTVFMRFRSFSMFSGLLVVSLIYSMVLYVSLGLSRFV